MKIIAINLQNLLLKKVESKIKIKGRVGIQYFNKRNM
jgi:hypothetical protein